MQTDISLLERYNQPVPRYTSYPTVPFWTDGLDIPAWKEGFRSRFLECNRSEGISIYVHLPFCEALCIYCGCNKKITTNHEVEDKYIDAVLKEWAIYLALMKEAPVIREIHLGGGTPTFFSPENLRRLITGLLQPSDIHRDHSFSIEGHPNNTTREHLETLSALGFRRISYGVQDLNEEVQRAIHRIQPFSHLQQASYEARHAGFTSINFDLVYGLPFQTPDRLRTTIEQSISLHPDRIAFYSYAHTPWMNKPQQLIDESSLPSASAKLELHRLGSSLMEEKGYSHIGMDHFARPSDELYHAWSEGRLHRDFMGYTTRKSGLLLGLGVSSISETGNAFAQNAKTLGAFYRAINGGTLAIQKNCFLSEEDKAFRRHILDIACKGHTELDETWSSTIDQWTIPFLRRLEADGLVCMDGKQIRLTETGRPFLRHVCKAFDLRLLRTEKTNSPLFSKAI